jgi:hypothetical protein
MSRFFVYSKGESRASFGSLSRGTQYSSSDGPIIAYVPTLWYVLILQLSVGAWQERLGAVHVEERHVKRDLEDLHRLRVSGMLSRDETDTLGVQASVDDVHSMERVQRGQNLREVVLQDSMVTGNAT